ncbi:M56 family metallopeptidase [Mucilaginibacter litoreus]|uniref:M56 family metallopeptidase n=1 Tax=Mucilaginibacter litoreus TaxID=1048221 RepID=A0ABW3AU79_9SPHI
MPALFVFLFKVNIALLLFCAGYYLVLRHLTFYTLNRVYLMAAIMFASAYPYIDLSSFVQRHGVLAKPVQTVVYSWQIPAANLIKPLEKPDYWQWATVLFWFGAVLLGIRFLMQLFSLYQLYRQSEPKQIKNFKVRVISGEAAPFSFWKSIYVNPANHDAKDLEAILQHEQVHVNGWHTLDIILAEISCIFYWFNPGVWLMKKAVRENIEFITDRNILNNGIDSKSYQYSLVNVSFNAATPGIVNHFNISTIKKRIIMMNAKRSSRYNLTRYAFVIPVIVGLLLVFTISKAEVAKPFKIKFQAAFKPVTIALKEAAQKVISITDTVPAKAKKLTVQPKRVDSLRSKHTVVFTIKTDTTKHGIIFLGTKNHKIDSLNIVMDGKRITPAQFNAIDPEKIRSINVVSAADAKRLLGNEFDFDNNNRIAFIITKDSEAGKILADKLGVNKQVNTIRINDINRDANNLTDTEKGLIAKLPGLTGKVGAVTILRTGDTLKFNKDLKDVVVTGYVSQNLKLKGDSIIVTDGLATKNGRVYVNSYSIKKDQGASATFLAKPENQFFIRSATDRISDKVIVIDGKVASKEEMKKLSAFDIDRMSVTNFADTIKYGEKAKNGVVYIYTKKAKQ